MRKLIIAMAMLAMTGAAFADQAVDQLGSAVGMTASETGVAIPAAPALDVEATEAEETAEAKGRCSDHHNNLPGCPGYCAKPQHQTKPACALPFHCRNNMQLHACRMHCVKYPKAQGCKNNKGLEAEAEDFDVDLAKANCATNPNAPGCPSYCNHHHNYPGCPMFCQLNPLHPSCGHVPAYCHTNPNGYNCPKSAEAEVEITAEDIEEAKGRCGYNNAKYPGCPNYCKKHPKHSSCALPFHCKGNTQLYACKKHCEKYPTSQGCNGNKSVEEVSFDEDLAKANCATNPNAPGCPLYCKDHHMYPGCPMFCQVNVWHPACGHVPAYCHTNPNGYGCPKAVDTDGEKGLVGYPKPPHPQWCSNHHGFPTCR